MGTLGDIPSDLVRWYGRRFRFLWATSVNEGLGFFIAYTGVIAAAALLAQSSLSLRSDDEHRLDEFLQSDHQARDEDRYVSALSVVLSALRPVQRVSHGTCPPGSYECLRARNVVNATVQLAGLIATRDPSREVMQPPLSVSDKGIPQDAAALSDIATILSSNHLPLEATTIAYTAVERGIDALRGIRQPKTGPPRSFASNPQSITMSDPPYTKESDPWSRLLSVCETSVGPPGTAVEEDRRLHQLGLAPALCERPGLDMSALEVPEQIAGLGSHDPAVRQQAIERIDRSTSMSFALEAALRANSVQSRTDREQSCKTGESQYACPGNGETRTFTAAYFISVDSVMRYWSDETIDPVVRLPKNIHWAAREYFETYERGTTSINDEYVSQPYLDIAGAGIVETICRAVPAPPLPTEKSPEMHVAGIACADLALSAAAVKALVSYIQQGPLAWAGLVRIMTSGEASLEVAPLKPHDSELNQLIDSPQWRSTFGPGWITGQASRGPSRLTLESRTWYVVPIARSGGNVLAVALRPSPASGVGRLARWAFLGSLCGAAFILLTATAQQSRRVALASRNLARLRGLPAAVIEVRVDPSAPTDHTRHSIVAGNDRAEEVLQIRFPNFGLSEGAMPLLWKVFDEKNLIPAELDGVTPENRLIDSEEIGESRRRGDTSTYFARLNSPRTIWQLPGKGLPSKPSEYWWVRMAAGPVVLPEWRGLGLHARGRLESSLGIIMPILDRKLSDKLDAILRSCRSSQR